MRHRSQLDSFMQMLLAVSKGEILQGGPEQFLIREQYLLDHQVSSVFQTSITNPSYEKAARQSQT